MTRCRVPIGPHLALGVEGEHLLAELVALPVGGGEGVEGGAVGDGAGPGEEILKPEEEVVWVAGVRLLIVVFFNIDIFGEGAFYPLVPSSFTLFVVKSTYLGFNTLRMYSNLFNPIC